MSVVIGQSEDFGLVFRHSIEICSMRKPLMVIEAYCDTFACLACLFGCHPVSSK